MDEAPCYQGLLIYLKNANQNDVIQGAGIYPGSYPIVLYIDGTDMKITNSGFSSPLNLPVNN